MKNSKNAILASFVADSYALGAHWIYDEEQLNTLPINWDTLNAPQVMWHKGKAKGDFTHYGDQSLFLLEYLTQNHAFDKKQYYDFWCNKMQNYQGYVDGATRNALENIDSGCTDLSICGRIAPLLLVSKTKEEFLAHTKAVVEMTHNTPLALETSQFFAELLWDTKENQNLHQNIHSLKENYPLLTKWIDEAIATKQSNTFTTIREFSPACDIDGGFAGVIHLLFLEEDFQTIMTKNAKAGGDSSARGMVVAMLLGVNNDFTLPSDWENNTNEIENIKKYLDF